MQSCYPALLETNPVPVSQGHFRLAGDDIHGHGEAVMDIYSIQPRTESGIKRLARKISRATGIKFSEALNVAARQGGYQSYQHFRNQAAAQMVEVELSVSWRRFNPEKTIGRVTARVSLRKPVDELVTAYGFKTSKRLKLFEMMDGRTLVSNRGIEDKDTALVFLGQAARTLQFIDATGLKPSRPRSHQEIIYAGGAHNEPMPRGDHATYWKEQESNRIVCMNEPYADARNLIPEQVDWAERHGYGIHRIEWGPLYRLNAGTVCDLISHRRTGADVGKILQALNNAPPPFDEQTADIEEYSWTFKA